MILNFILGALAVLSLLLLIWQWLAAIRFPLHKRVSAHSFPPAVSLLKPLKGCDHWTESCLRSWFAQEYTGRVQLLFGVASAEDPVCGIVRNLQAEFLQADSQLIVCGPLLGPNAKVSKLVELEQAAKHDVLVISDADVRVPADFLSNVVEPLRESSGSSNPASDPNDTCGLVNCFYFLANPITPAMHWEAIAVNADFWSQVLQSATLKPLDFALGAVMATRRPALQRIGGLKPLADCLADDYQLGHRIARSGYSIALSTVVVECLSDPMDWTAVAKHQLRWARTIRVCQPAPYFLSILSNATLWPLIWLLANPVKWVLAFWVACGVIRVAAAWDLQRRLTRSGAHLAYSWFVPLKDLLQAVIWLLAFAGNRIEWRGESMQLRRDGTLVRVDKT